MNVWKRRLVALVAVGAGSAGLISTAGAQTPPSIPDFTIPSFTLPTFTIPTTPPPTMPPSSTVTTSPPPTMPPSTTVTTSPPPTMPPTSFPSTSIPGVPSPSDFLDEIFEEIVEDLFDRFEEGGETFDELRAILDEIIASF
jgi:hypothetical protein